MEKDFNDIIADLPDVVQELIKKHLPAIQKMTVDEIKALAEYIIAGRSLEAHRAIASKMSDGELLAALDHGIEDTETLNAANTEAIESQKEIATSITLALVTLGLSVIAKKYIPTLPGE